MGVSQKCRGAAFAMAAAGAVLASQAAQAEDTTFLGLKLNGSFGEGGFSRYVPSVTNPLFNETPFITTEAKPVYIFHRIPEEFATDGGDINVAALQLRLAITERLGFIATADGYTNIDFNDESTLPDDDGPNDVAAGFKYAIWNKPKEGEIVTLGFRYTAPAGDLESGSVDLNGVDSGFLNPFLSAAVIADDFWQVQGSLGAQVSISGDNRSFIHGSLHVDYQAIPDAFPFFELNFFAPVSGGTQLSGSLGSVTGAEFVDTGAEDPVAIVTVGGGLRYRIADNFIFGTGIEGNVINKNDTLFGLRLTTDLTIHF